MVGVLPYGSRRHAPRLNASLRLRPRPCAHHYLSHQNKEGADAIARIIRELEDRGYITRCRVRNQAGKFTDMEYKILECPLLKGEGHGISESGVAFAMNRMLRLIDETTKRSAL